MPRARSSTKREYLTTFEVARLLNVSPPTVVNWVNTGALTAHRTPGGHRRISSDDVPKFAKKMGYPVPPDLIEGSGAVERGLLDPHVDEHPRRDVNHLMPRSISAAFAAIALTAPRVFISYAHETAEHDERVLALSDRLRGSGLDSWVDRYSPYPVEGWPRWMQMQMEAAKFVVLICTPTWAKRFERNPTEGRGVTWEGILARSWLYESGGRNTEEKTFVPVWYGDEGRKAVPRVLRELPGHDLLRSGGVDDMIARLRGRSAVRVPPVVAHDGMPDLPRPREVVEALRIERERLRAAGAAVQTIDQQIRETEAELNAPLGLVPGHRLLGRYLLEERVGYGTYGTVWKALEMQRGRPIRTVAVKVLHEQHVANQTELARFFRGARALARLEHPNIVRLYLPDGEESGRFFYVMEYLDGGDLHTRVASGTISQQDAMHAVLEAAKGVVAAHAAGVIHRDVKPQNVLLSRSGEVRVADFDLARLPDSVAGSTRVAATWVYGAPELLRNAGEASFQCDVFGLAMTAAFCMLGRPLDDDILYERDTVLQEIPSGIREVVAKGISRRAVDRWPSVMAFSNAMIEALDIAG